MRGFIRRQVVAILAVCLLLSGCGDKLLELTSEEEAVIINASTDKVSKLNRFQEKGLTYVAPEAEEPETGALPVISETDTVEPTETPGLPGEETPGTQETDDSGAQGESESQAVSLTEALGIADIAAEYAGHTESESYKEGEVYSLAAKDGNTYVVLAFNLTNTGTQAIECNFLSQQPDFQLTINELPNIPVKVTLMMNDLSTFVGTIEPGQTQNTILLFEVSKENAADIQSMNLVLNRDGAQYRISLE
ncbi:hypothetical protein LQZ18_10130 [Lachnospiraceae bacterium ZAX-1]